MAPIAVQYCTQSDLEMLFSAEGVDLRLDDDGDGSVDAAELSRLTGACINWGTAKVNMYCLGLYDAADLARNWMVNHYATVISGRYLASRRVNPVPESLMALYEEALADLKEIKVQRIFFNDIGLRSVAWPAWSNVRVDPRYWLRQTRVERPISEKTPVRGITQNVDLIADRTIEF